MTNFCVLQYNRRAVHAYRIVQTTRMLLLKSEATTYYARSVYPPTLRIFSSQKLNNGLRQNLVEEVDAIRFQSPSVLDV